MKIKNTLMGLALVTACAVSVPPVAHAQIGIGIHLGRPSETSVWIGGFWTTGEHRRYVRSHWEEPPYEHGRWHGGRWYHQDEHWEHEGERRGGGHGRGPGRQEKARGEGHGEGHGKGHDKH